MHRMREIARVCATACRRAVNESPPHRQPDRQPLTLDRAQLHLHPRGGLHRCNPGISSICACRAARSSMARTPSTRANDNLNDNPIDNLPLILA
jgi:hypothetical protein